MKKSFFAVFIILFVLLGRKPAYAQETINLVPTAAPKRIESSDNLLIFFKNKPTVRTLINIADQTEDLSFRYGLPNSNIMVADPGSQDKNEVMENLRQNPQISAVTNDPDFRLLAVTNDPGMADADVPGITKIQWNLFNMKFAGERTSAWDLTTGSAGVNVAVIDTGVDSAHEDLAGKLSSLVDCTSSPCQELSSMTANPQDFTSGHGTYVSGLVAAATNNGIGIAGSGYNTRMMMIRVMDSGGRIRFSHLINAIHWAADHGTKVANMSIGQLEENLDPVVIAQIQTAVQYAWTKGVLVVAAAGNCGGDTSGKESCAILDDNGDIIGYASNSKHYPAAAINVLSVASIKYDNTLASYSNRNDASKPAVGNWISVSAPGGECSSASDKYYCIASAWPGNNYSYVAGTSMAAPQVTGLAALLLAVNPLLTNSQVKSIIESTADRSIAVQSTNNGAADALAAVRRALVMPPSSTPTTTPTPSATATPPSAPPTATPTASATPIITATPTPTLAYTNSPPRLPKIPPDPYPSPPFCPQSTTDDSSCTLEGKNRGDANCDSRIDTRDYLVLYNQYDTQPVAQPVNQNANFSCREGDDSTYFVDLTDFEIWRKNALNSP